MSDYKHLDQKFGPNFVKYELDGASDTKAEIVHTYFKDLNEFSFDIVIEGRADYASIHANVPGEQMIELAEFILTKAREGKKHASFNVEDSTR